MIWPAGWVMRRSWCEVSTSYPRRHRGRRAAIRARGSTSTDSPRIRAHDGSNPTYARLFTPSAASIVPSPPDRACPLRRPSAARRRCRPERLGPLPATAQDRGSDVVRRGLPTDDVIVLDVRRIAPSNRAPVMLVRPCGGRPVFTWPNLAPPDARSREPAYVTPASTAADAVRDDVRECMLDHLHDEDSCRRPPSTRCRPAKATASSRTGGRRNAVLGVTECAGRKVGRLRGIGSHGTRGVASGPRWPSFCSTSAMAARYVRSACSPAA